MLNFEWHMLKSLCEISFLEFQIVVNISLSWEGGERRMCFQLPPTEFQSHLLPNPKESLKFCFSLLFFSRWIQNFGLNVVSSQHATRWDFSPCCLKKQNVCQKSSFFSVLLSCCYTVFQMPDFCPKIQVYKNIWIFARKIGTLSFLV